MILYTLAGMFLITLGGCVATATRGIVNESGEKIPQEYITMDRGMKVEFEKIKAEAEPIFKIPDFPPIDLEMR